MSDKEKEAEIQRDRRASETSEGEPEPDFKPVITLPEVEVSTNEEDEDVLAKFRAKLYRFFCNVEESPEWKERGTGELKILRHKENNSVRVVMRRDKTLKVCANHFITPFMELKPSFGCSKAFVYIVVADFADEEPKTECLAVKFATEDIANQFKAKFYEAQEIVKTKCKLYCESEETNSDEEKAVLKGDEITEKLAGLDVSKGSLNEDQKSN